MQIITLRVGDRVQLKKPHPCGGSTFDILRVGGEVRVRCECCGRDITIDRIKLEKLIRKHLPLEATNGEGKES